MKAAVLVSPRKIEIQERPLPQPGPGQVRLKVAAVGVCGSDVHYYEHGRIGSAVVRYPTLLGHEPAGIVDAVGPGVKLAVGTRVAIEPADPCYVCETCRSGHPNACPQVKFLGTPPHDGIYAEYHVMPEHCCFPIPSNLSLVEAAMLEPLGVGLHAVELARLRLGDQVAIFGSGPIGIVTLMAAKAAGAGQVYMTDLVPERLEFARKMGADAVFDAREGDPVTWVKELTGGRGVDVAFEAAGQQATVKHACQTPKVCGTTVIIGIPSVDEFLFPMHDMRRKELTVINCRRSNWEALRCLDLAATGRLDLKPLATHFFPLERVTEAFDLVNRYADGVIRAVILPNADLNPQAAG